MVAVDGGFSAEYVPESQSTTYGHRSGPWTISVGAVPFYKAPPYSTATPIRSESFSSAGKPILGRDKEGAYTEYFWYPTGPYLSAPDGTNTTFFGYDITNKDGDAFPNFFGTSAAAPNLAAGAALMREAFPTATQVQVAHALAKTARPLNGTPRQIFNAQGGYGLADVNAAMAKLASTIHIGVLMDDGDAGFTTSGPWVKNTTGGYSGDHRTLGKGKSGYAAWVFDSLPDGNYEILTMWKAGSGRSYDATYKVWDGGTLVSQFAVDQRIRPAGPTVDGKVWQSLGIVTIADGQLLVRLDGSPNGSVDADALRIVRSTGTLATNRTAGPGGPLARMYTAVASPLEWAIASVMNMILRSRTTTPPMLVVFACRLAIAAWALWTADAAASQASRRAELVDVAMARGERVWQEIGREEPAPGLSCRELFSYALTLCEARLHPDRLERLFDLATRMQERDPAAKGYGNFRWYWRDSGVTDLNAVEFCSYDMHLIRRLHRDWLPEAARTKLEQLVAAALEGCLRHRVRPSYTNIAILNAANLVTLGESLDHAEAADEGYRRLLDMAADTWRNGLHEYCSPSYYAIDIQGLSAIERFAARKHGRDLARAMLELVWTDIALNYFPAGGRLAGPHSRTYDLLRGSGLLQQTLRWEGWVDVPLAKSTEVIHVAQGTWSPPARLMEQARTHLPRLVRQSWGPRMAESRTHWLASDVTLGCSGACYGDHDSPLTFDLPGPPGGVRGSFVPDGREDPYGRKKYATGLAGHPKALHVKPFWAAAQRDTDALGLVVYRDGDLAGEHSINLQSHVVMPGNVDGLWLRGTRLERPRATPESPTCIPVASGDAIVLRKGTAAVGLRIVWSRAQDGAPAEAAIIDDGNEFGAIRLSIEHRRAPATTQAAAAIWIRVGSGLESPEAFDAWRGAFELAAAPRVDVENDRIHVAVAGSSGAVSVAARAPFADGGPVDLDPAPSRAVLELDGEEIGRPLFSSLEPFASFEAACDPARVIDVPADGQVRFEAETGFVLPRMEIGEDERDVRYVWQPDVASGGASPSRGAMPSGCAIWRLRLPRDGRYRLWGRVLAPDGGHDSFHIAVDDSEGRRLAEGDWHLPRSTEWQWAPAALGAGREPIPLELQAGPLDGPTDAVGRNEHARGKTVQLTVSPREPGTKLDALWLTSDPDAQPPTAIPAASDSVTDSVTDRAEDRADDRASACDRVSSMQAEAEAAGKASWGHWGDQPDRYAAWSNHSNRLIPVYTFGTTLDGLAGSKSIYRDETRLRDLYGRLPDQTLNPSADYFDQTDIHRLQRAAADAGKRIIVLVVFDGLDWHTTRTAAIATNGRVDYAEGRGTGLFFQDYRGAATDFGFFVTSPANDGTKFDVDAQAIRNPGGERPGGYDASRGGATPWDPRASMRYLTGRDRDVPHPFTDSAASATSLCSGRKTYNDSINVGPSGEQFEPIARLLQSRGWAVGAVSSVPVSHATPACAYANNVSRDDYQDISRDLLGEPSIAHREPLPGLDVLVGGGFGVTKTEEADQGRNFEPGNKYVADSTLELIDSAQGGRYRVAKRSAGRRGADVLAEAARDAIAGKQRLFGLFGAAEGHLPFQTADGGYDPGESRTDRDGEIDPLHKKYGGTIRYTPADVAENPTLAAMATTAMDVLSAKGPFWLMVEAGDVDWASHANNIDTCIGAINSGDEAFRAVVEWIERHEAWDEAVVIVTSDHGHPFVLVDPRAFTLDGCPVSAVGPPGTGKDADEVH